MELWLVMEEIFDALANSSCKLREFWKFPFLMAKEPSTQIDDNRLQAELECQIEASPCHAEGSVVSIRFVTQTPNMECYPTQFEVLLLHPLEQFFPRTLQSSELLS